MDSSSDDQSRIHSSIDVAVPTSRRKGSILSDPQRRRDAGWGWPTVPLWFGCAVLCTTLVCIVGLTPYFAMESNNNVIIATVVDFYTTVMLSTGARAEAKTTNELISVFVGRSQALFKPQLMTAVNFSDPFWDREWQLFFLGEDATLPRQFLYMDLATGSMTGQLLNSSGEPLRIVGNANDVNFTAYRRRASPSLQFEAVDIVSQRFPPMILFQNFISQNTSLALMFGIGSGMEENMVYGYGAAVFSPLTSPPLSVPVGILLSLFPFEYILPSSETLRNEVTNQVSGHSIFLDNFGGVVWCSHPQIEKNIYVPIGTVGAVCASEEYNNHTTSVCRHSIKTLEKIWPVLGPAHDAFFARTNQQTFSGTTLSNFGVSRKNFTSAVFDFDGVEYLVAGTPMSMPGTGLWWGASITPTHASTILGPFIENRQQVVLIVALVCAGMALLVLVATYVLMRPLSALMHDMIAALRLQTQSDRYASAVTLHAPRETSLAEACCNRRLYVVELREIEVAVQMLHVLLQDVAKVLPPPVIQIIRSSLAQRDLAPHEDEAESGSASSGALFPVTKFLEAVDLPGNIGSGDNVEHMLAWFEDYYRANGTAPLDIDDSYANSAGVSMRDELLPVARSNVGSQLNDPVSIINVQQEDPHDNAADLILLQLEVASTNASSILMNPTVSLRQPRRRGFVMAVSLEELRAEPDHFAAALSPLLALMWFHGGEVELIERTVVIATFGCYTQLANAADSAVACAAAVAALEQDAPGQRGLPPGSARPHARSLIAAGAGAQRWCSVAIDCGWFESSTFSCMLPGGHIARRQVVSSAARDVAVRMLPLCGVLGERFLISGEALGRVSESALNGCVPVVVDRLKFDWHRQANVSRRDSVFVFAVQREADSSTPSSLLHIQLEVQRCNAQLTADGFRLMVNARYSEAAEHFTRALDSEHATSRCRRNWTRMLALARVFASMEGVGPHADSADAALYFRGECCVFDVSAAEQLYVDECAAESGHRGIERDRRIEFSKA
ncbi:membrane-associated protein, putative [Bodo saltans]|uniref:Membrane-associated protein, putative n=1 Tax=Bodo saltans TaxID=75058 RepID=A0A0S4IZH9_BODSA|nr:membrane-associated protein, putative [Bodo saltans]|eukprot:CUG27460.1 membrane-associated protein, putative [Bodo saltans]